MSVKEYFKMVGFMPPELFVVQEKHYREYYV